jgi:protein-S-isoprenylcysteine O-methyltransferase Ste14
VSSQGRGSGSALVALLARRRVPLGALTALAALVLARPTWTSWLVGAVVACAGEGIRVWAAGHIEKDKEVTTSGPYRWMRHPLYVGSSVMAVGIVLATRSWVVAFLATVYMVSTLTAAVTTEEARLRLAFGDTYDRYARAEVRGVARSFSLERAMRNREYRAVAGVVGGFLVLAFRVALHL